MNILCVPQHEPHTQDNPSLEKDLQYSLCSTSKALLYKRAHCSRGELHAHICPCWAHGPLCKRLDQLVEQQVPCPGLQGAQGIGISTQQGLLAIIELIRGEASGARLLAQPQHGLARD